MNIIKMKSHNISIKNKIAYINKKHDQIRKKNKYV